MMEEFKTAVLEEIEFENPKKISSTDTGNRTGNTT